jgi:hypothetical protein
MKPSDDLVVVYKTQGMISAEIIKAKLESAGIPALLKYESLGPVLAVTVDGLGQVKVLVPQEREQEARELLGELK